MMGNASQPGASLYLSGYDDNNWSYRNPVYTNLLSESGAMRADSVIYKLNLKRE